MISLTVIAEFYWASFSSAVMVMNTMHVNYTMPKTAQTERLADVFNCSLFGVF